MLLMLPTCSHYLHFYVIPSTFILPQTVFLFGGAGCIQVIGTLGGKDWGVALCEPDTHSFILKINTEYLLFARLWIKSLNTLKKIKAWLCLPKRTRKGKRKSCHLWGAYYVQGRVLSTVHTLSDVSFLPTVRPAFLCRLHEEVETRKVQSVLWAFELGAGKRQQWKLVPI